jgi:hypothetical protein
LKLAKKDQVTDYGAKELVIRNLVKNIEASILERMVLWNETNWLMELGKMWGRLFPMTLS